MQHTTHKTAFSIDGYLMLVLLCGIGLLVFLSGTIFLVPVAGIALFLGLTGFTVNAPNDVKVITFLGNYIGTLEKTGFLWTVPFSTKNHLSLKMVNFNTNVLKVNDLKGNPIEIAAVVVWRVRDAAMALFNVDSYVNFVANQSEIALRTIAAAHTYDGNEQELSLRGNAAEISALLVQELQAKMDVAGIYIEEARLSHLAYAPEIATAMLKRQQAEASLQARKYLVENALMIVDNVLAHFEQDNRVQFSSDKKADLVNNLIVTLASSHDAEPVLNLSSK